MNSIVRELTDDAMDEYRERGNRHNNNIVDKVHTKRMKQLYQLLCQRNMDHINTVCNPEKLHVEMQHLAECTHATVECSQFRQRVHDSLAIPHHDPFAELQIAIAIACGADALGRTPSATVFTFGPDARWRWNAAHDGLAELDVDKVLGALSASVRK